MDDHDSNEEWLRMRTYPGIELEPHDRLALVLCGIVGPVVEESAAPVRCKLTEVEDGD